MTSLDTEPRTEHATRRPRKPSGWLRWSLNALVVVAFLWSASAIEISWEQIRDAPASAWRIFGLMFFPPAVGELGDAMLDMVESLHIAWLGTLIGAVASFPLGFLAAKNVTSRAGSTAVRQVLNAIRAVPELILAIAFIPIAGLGPFAGTLAIGLHSIGTLGKLTSEVIEGIDAGPVEAATASGSRRSAVMRWGVLPQVLPEVVAFWLYRFEINIRASAILGVVGAGGIGGTLSEFVTYRRWDQAGMVVLVVIVVTIAVDMVSGAIRRRIIRGPGGATTSARQTMVAEEQL